MSTPFLYTRDGRREEDAGGRKKRLELIHGDTVATGPSEPCQQFNQCI